MFFGRKKPRQELILVVRSDSVSAGVVSYPPGERPVLHLYLTDAVRPVKDLDALTSSVRATLARVLDRLIMYTPLHIANVHVVFSAPWYRAISHVERDHFRKPRVVREDDVRVLMKRSRDAMKGGFSEYYPDPIEERLMSIRINGYELQDPYGKRATLLETHMYASAASTGLKDIVDHELTRVLGSTEVDYTSLAFTSFSVFTYFFKHQASFTLIDVAGEGTDIIVIRNGSIEEVASSALGPTRLARKRSERTGEPMDHARLVFESTYENAVVAPGKEVQGEESNVVVNDEEIYDWRYSLANIFSSHAAFLPRQIYILAESDVRSAAAMHLKDVLAESMGTVELFTLKEKDFEPFVEVLNKQKPDVFLLLSTLFHVSSARADDAL